MKENSTKISDVLKGREFGQTVSPEVFGKIMSGELSLEKHITVAPKEVTVVEFSSLYGTEGWQIILEKYMDSTLTPSQEKIFKGMLRKMQSVLRGLQKEARK